MAEVLKRIPPHDGTSTFSFTVVFEGGDEASEPDRTIEVTNGGELRIPPQRLRIRNVNAQGEEQGSPLYDVAPLGQHLKIRFRPPLEATQEDARN